MPAIVESIEISRRPEDVFAYASDFAHFPEWQGGVLSVRPEGGAPLAVDSRAVVTRRVGPRELPRAEEIAELNRPQSWPLIDLLLTFLTRGSTELALRPRPAGEEEEAGQKVV